MKREVFLRTAHNYDMDVVSRETTLDFDEEEMPSRTQQQFAEEADINEIVRRFGITGEVPGDFKAPVSGDFTGITDFHTAMNAVRAAQEEFDSLPAEIRERFANDPQQLMMFVGDDKNRDEARKLGLLQPVPEKTRDVVTAVDDLAKLMTPKS